MRNTNPKNCNYLQRPALLTKHFVFVLCVLCASVVNIPAQDYKTLKHGIEYAEVTKEISGLKVNMNLLRLDLKKVRLDVVHALDAAIGTEKTSAMAVRRVSGLSDTSTMRARPFSSMWVSLLISRAAGA